MAQYFIFICIYLFILLFKWHISNMCPSIRKGKGRIRKGILH